MNKLILLTSVTMFAINISESLAAINCVFSNNGKTVTITGGGSDSVSDSACTKSNSSSEEEGWSYNSGWKNTITSVNIGTGVTSIGDGAFYGASSLTNITFPDSLTSIGNSAFGNASSLTSITIPDNINTEGWIVSAFSGLSANIVCQGGLNTCYEKLAKYFTSATCPQSLKDAGKGNLCNCANFFMMSCISPSRISEATQNQCGGKYTWDETSNPKCRHMTDNECANSAQYYINNGQCKSMPGSKTTCKNADFLWSGSSCVKSCASGFVEWDNECLSEYPFAKKRWTPAEANEWLHDGNDNFVIITFKK